MANIELPTLPNFVTVTTHGASVKVDVTMLTEAEIKELGDRWTLALFDHAESRRQHHHAMDRLNASIEAQS